MKERPILFSAPMVRAILAGAKTQTRRIATQKRSTEPMTDEWCPYGKPGDRLWVREAFRFLDTFDCDSPSRVAERCVDAGYKKPWAPTHYEADEVRVEWRSVGPDLHARPVAGKLRPSMFMPRWASRITLEVTGVRVERLQNISRGDAMAEGCPFPNMAGGEDPRVWYEHLWCDLNGADAWRANPWVWVVTFKRAQRP